jgi:hypothetical protein
VTESGSDFERKQSMECDGEIGNGKPPWRPERRFVAEAGTRFSPSSQDPVRTARNLPC